MISRAGSRGELATVMAVFTKQWALSRAEVQGRPRASVVVPVFDRVGPLRALLDSLAVQALRSGWFELVIADDGSAPDMEECVRTYASHFDRVVFVSGPNAGPGLARNRGASVASAAIFAFVDSDCIADPGWLEALVSGVGDCAEIAHGPVRSTVPPMEPFVHSIRVESSLTFGANFAIAAGVFRQLHGFDPRISRIAEDHEFFERAVSAGVRTRFVPAAVVSHPPRLKTVRFPWSEWPTQVVLGASLRAFYEVTSRRKDMARINRLHLGRALIKGAILLAPAIALSSRPLAWPLGALLLMGLSFVKWLRVNRALAAARENLSVPFSQALRWALVFPIVDLAILAIRARLGLLFLR